MANTNFKVDNGLLVSSGDSTFQANVTVNAHLIVKQTLSVNGDVTVEGNLTYSNTSISGELIPTANGVLLGNTTRRFTVSSDNLNISNSIITANQATINIRAGSGIVANATGISVNASAISNGILNIGQGGTNGSTRAAGLNNLLPAQNSSVIGYFLKTDGTDASWINGVGFTGSQGQIGFTGSFGTTGFTGSFGTTGFTGSRGFTGSVGFTGSAGTNGNDGYTGSQGQVGFTGSRGFTGSVGYTGSAGIDGIDGYTGSRGAVGFTGSFGTTGFTGSFGTTGFTGSFGTTGFTGSQGVTGFTGSFGTTGFTGSRGFTGSQGDKGGFRYDFSVDTTNADPGTGIFKFNNVTIASVTEIYIDNALTSGASLSTYLNTVDDSTNDPKGYIIIQSNANWDSTIAIFQINSVTAPTGYKTLGVTYVSGTAPSDGEECVISFTRSGDAGATGYTGSFGTTGFTGSRGFTGSVGFTGSRGFTGSTAPNAAPLLRHVTSTWTSGGEVTVSTASASGAATKGDIWIKYTA